MSNGLKQGDRVVFRSRDLAAWVGTVTDARGDYAWISWASGGEVRPPRKEWIGNIRKIEESKGCATCRQILNDTGA